MVKTFWWSSKRAVVWHPVWKTMRNQETPSPYLVPQMTTTKLIQNNGKSGGLDDGTSDSSGFQSYVSPQDFQRRPGASANPNATASWRASSGSLCWRQLLRFWRPTSLAPCPSTSLERIFDLQDIGPWQAGQPVSKVQKFRKHRGGRARKGLRLVLYSLRLWESWFLSKKHEQLGLRMPKKCQKVSFFVKKPGFD